jgi:hypothetical protein
MIPHELTAFLVGVVLAISVVTVLTVLRDRRRLAELTARIEAADRAAAESLARVSKAPHGAFAETLARAPDAFAEARARAAVLAAQIPPEIASGEAPDLNAPRFLWWTTWEQAKQVETAILPPWLARLVARRLALNWSGTSVFHPPGFDQVVAPREDLGDACVITAAEFGPVFASPGQVTDLAGNPVKVAIDF